MPADGLTKPLLKTKFKLFIKQLGLTDVPPTPENDEEDDGTLI